ncbi:SusC/RagA family TonB-linked outer membrane protein [Salegentibacter sp. T436]|uniref:SusC/RagA family TonB-linked outer membrane protein n=1 Tax=Salegentibacter sp. T436 TaxID=1729720 RepID=UPI00094A2186|nr:SusC/RagA family TonB-linked outer membrane protein [Salegentibacter sp. T436]APS37440.1 SusC/RagA family TonB-linked outer membrane protein [Salegentibacter sp. T436]
MKNNYSRLKWVALIILGGILMFLSMVATAATPTPLPLLQQEVTGKVEDQNGLPIPGVTITIKNTNRGTVTNLDGEYNITAPANGTLVFSFIGYKTVEIPVDNNEELNIQLEEDIAALGEVQINAGYYNTTDRERTGSISRVSGEDIEMQPVESPLAALQGRIPGVEIEQPSGIAGLATSIRIRGRNSLRLEGDYPLFIIDGVPVNSSPINSTGPFSSGSGIDPLNTLNLANIESIEVLKDADATAIYGSRGANGVVLITTKTRNLNKEHTSFEASFYSGVSNVSNRMEVMNTDQYLSVRREAFENDGVTPSEINAPDLTLWDQDRSTDWQEVLMGETAAISNVNMSLSGGSENTSFLLGGSYQNKDDVFPGNFGYDKVTSNFNLHHNSKDQRLSIDFSANYGVDHNELFYGTNFVRLAITLPPNAPALYNENGSLNWADGSWTNPLASLYRPQQIKTENLLSSLSLSYKLFEGLKLKTNLGYSTLKNEETTRNLLNSYNPDSWDRISLSSYHSNTKRSSWIIEPQLQYNKRLGKLDLNILVGGTLQQDQSSYIFLEGNGYGDDHLVGNLSTADEIRVNSNEHIDYRYSALFGRLALNWNKKYYLNFTGRRDGSSRFGTNNRFANFGAIGTAWIFSDEAFIQKNLSFLSFGKFRGSYGTTGSDQIPDYGYMDTYETTSGPGGLYPTQLLNPDFSWEINKKLELALQLGFLEDRLNLEVNWYRNRSTNQLTGYPLPYTTGFSSVQANLPATIQNTGWEIALNTINFQQSDFTWNSSVNFTVPKNKLVKFNDLELTPYRQTYKIGEPLDIAILYQFDGINPETGRYQIADINNDGRLNFNDKTVIKRIGRKFYGGLQNNLKLKNFEIDFLLEYINQSSHTYLSQMTNAPGRYGNNSIEILDSWRQEGDDPHVQKLSQGIPSLFSYLDAVESDLVIGDASFLRLKTLSISYNLPSAITNSLAFQSFNLFLQGQNLFTITDYIGLDPQGGQAVPPLRTITAGLRVNL